MGQTNNQTDFFNSLTRIHVLRCASWVYAMADRSRLDSVTQRRCNTHPTRRQTGQLRAHVHCPSPVVSNAHWSDRTDGCFFLLFFYFLSSSRVSSPDPAVDCFQSVSKQTESQIGCFGSVARGVLACPPTGTPNMESFPPVLGADCVTCQPSTASTGSTTTKIYFVESSCRSNKARWLIGGCRSR